MSRLDKEKYIFGSFFLLANKLQAKGDIYLAHEEITTKQWFLIASILQFGKKPPMLTEVASLMGSSRQNVKQIALKLEEKGFLILEKDEVDNRRIRLRLTEKNQDFWTTREEKDRDFISNLFKTLSIEEIDRMYDGFEKLFKAID